MEKQTKHNHRVTRYVMIPVRMIETATPATAPDIIMVSLWSSSVVFTVVVVVESEGKTRCAKYYHVL